MLQIWIVSAGFSMTGSYVTTDLTNVIFFLLAILLATKKSDRVQLIGVMTAWGLGIASFTISWISTKP